MSEIATEAQLLEWKTLTNKIFGPLQMAVEKANAKALAEDIEKADALEPYEPAPIHPWVYTAWDSYNYRQLVSQVPFEWDNSCYTKLDVSCLSPNIIQKFRADVQEVSDRNQARYQRNKERAVRLAKALVSLGLIDYVKTGTSRGRTVPVRLAERLISHVPPPPGVSDSAAHTAERWLEEKRRRAFAEEQKVKNNEAAERLVKIGKRLGVDFTLEDATRYEARLEERLERLEKGE